MKGDIHTNQRARSRASKKQITETPRNQNPIVKAGFAAFVLLLAAGVCARGPVAGAARQSTSKTAAHLARTIAVTDTGRLKLVHNGGEYITEEGRATGTVPGKVRALLEVGAIVVAKFTIYTSVGTISGVGSGKPKGRSEEPSFAGRMTVSHGTGRYKHVHGHGGFYGTLNRVTYKMVVQTTGTLSY
jgi:hypothetical protein